MLEVVQEEETVLRLGDPPANGRVAAAEYRDHTSEHHIVLRADIPHLDSGHGGLLSRRSISRIPNDDRHPTSRVLSHAARKVHPTRFRRPLRGRGGWRPFHE